MSNTSEIRLIDIGMQTHMAVKTGEQWLTLQNQWSCDAYHGIPYSFSQKLIESTILNIVYILPIFKAEESS